ncbi:hypothetical protein [Xanthomonas campestris]|uniref:hypothetical protein n=1 Tax=Xanthomonas campestris TaxID=339 RepID=UPI0023662E91|nr:hypothetical protein [Xanthomonas campestris]WDJ06904.1 hypothetical protein JH261_04435 [Xanthomonas campestris pv. incanae]
MSELDEMLNRNQRWGEVSKLFKVTALISFFIVCVAELLRENIVMIYVSGNILSRSDLYLICMYFFAVPFIVFRVKKALHGYAFPSYRLLDRFFYTCAIVALTPVLIGTPVVLSFFGEEGQGRAGAIYRLMSNFFGLAIVGAFVFYGVSISLWILIFGIHGLWKKRIEVRHER